MDEELVIVTNIENVIDILVECGICKRTDINGPEKGWYRSFAQHIGWVSLVYRKEPNTTVIYYRRPTRNIMPPFHNLLKEYFEWANIQVL